MTESAKITFIARRVGDVDDVTDLVAILFPGNQNQQHAAARILLVLKAADVPVASFSDLERRHGISRRTLQRTRAKLARLGLIEYASALSSRYGGQHGWRLSGRMSTALRQLADRVDRWRNDQRPERMEKDERLVGSRG
jgi:DNA-binding HxlR family transcriptional regulator